MTWKSPVAVAFWPRKSVTVIGPSVAVGGTSAMICWSEIQPNRAGAPLNWTPVASKKLAPFRITPPPAAATPGSNESRTNGTVNDARLWVVPAGFVTLIGPVCAPVGTAIRIDVGERTVMSFWTAPPVTHVTAVAKPMKAPLIVTSDPAPPTLGTKLGIAGALMPVNEPTLRELPYAVVTVILPLGAVAGTVTVSSESVPVAPGAGVAPIFTTPP